MKYEHKNFKVEIAPELVQDLKSVCGLDAEKELRNIFLHQIIIEILSDDDNELKEKVQMEFVNRKEAA